MKKILLVLALVAAAALSACSKGPEPIRWGIDMCDQCRMILGDKRFAAELVADRVYKFDGVDELARFRAAHPEKKGAMLVTDGDSGNLIPAEKAVYLSSPDLTAPMGGHVMSFASRQEALAFAVRHGVNSVRFVADALTAKGGDDAGH